MRAFRGYGLQQGITESSRMVLERPTRQGESPVHEIERNMAVSRVPRDTRNLVGRTGDHPRRLNTT